MSIEQALAQLREDVGEEILPIILQRTLKELELRQLQLQRALQARNVAAIADAAHPLKSVAATMGLTQLAQAADISETLARSAQDNPTLVATQDLLLALEQGERALRAVQFGPAMRLHAG
jgi:HPt (histidine-containing phosphotransfer) domain-containing protein